MYECVHVLCAIHVLKCLSAPAFMKMINGGPVGFNGERGRARAVTLIKQNSRTMATSPLEPPLRFGRHLR